MFPLVFLPGEGNVAVVFLAGEGEGGGGEWIWQCYSQRSYPMHLVVITI
jgi:hypothetical protein